MKALIISTRSNLPFANAEVQSIINAFNADVTVLLDATAEKIYAFDWTVQYDEIFWIGHGDTDGLIVEDNAGNLVHLDIGFLRPCFVSSNPRLIYINTCSSVSLAEQIFASVPSATIICTEVNVPDSTAYWTMNMFVNSYVKTEDIHLSFSMSRPGGINRIYRIIPEYVERGGPQVKGEQTSMTDFRFEVMRLQQMIQEINSLLAGGKYNEMGLVKRIGAIELETHKIDLIHSSLNEIKSSLVQFDSRLRVLEVQVSETMVMKERKTLSQSSSQVLIALLTLITIMVTIAAYNLAN